MCTGALINSVEGNHFWARTMDFATDFFTSGGGLLYFPKDMELNLLSGTIKNKYDFFGMGMPNTYFLADAINSAGLTGGSFYFEEATCASDESLLKKNKQKIVLDEIIALCMAQCSSVEEVAFLVSNFVVINKSTKMSMFNPDSFLPIHAIFTDITGQSIVLEAISNGEFKIYSDTSGTIANSPTYDWHLTNLRNYVNLSDYTKKNLILQA